MGPTGPVKQRNQSDKRFYNLDSGVITIDGIDISDVKIKSLRKQMGVMLQDSFIFSGTIMDNIRYGNMEAEDDKVIEAPRRLEAMILLSGWKWLLYRGERGKPFVGRSEATNQLCQGFACGSQDSYSR